MHLLQALCSILIAQLAGVIGSLATTPNIDTWYAALTKPAWNPPNWIFGPVWITLYVMMGLAAFLIWQRRSKKGAIPALWIYGIQLVLNTLWSIIFFALHNPALALVEIIVLLLTIIVTTVLFWRIHKGAALLLVPYIAWVGFATCLTYAIWQLN